MEPFKSYQCIHLNLAAQETWLERSLHDHGYYIVLWWNEIPIGHLFVKPGEELPLPLFEKRVTHAASWALQHYTANASAQANTLYDLRNSFNNILANSDHEPAIYDVSVVICTRDRAESLHQCLSSLTSLIHKPKEIIVVDNASADSRTHETALVFPEVKYIREERAGLDIARNTGARAATASIVLYTDDDTVIHSRWVAEVYRTFNDPSIAAMTGLVLAAELDTEAQWIFERYWPFNRGFVDKRYDRAFFYATLSKGVPVWTIGAGANMAFRKSIFTATGYFDERLDVGAAGCNGDSEMWYRVLASGYSIQYNPRAVVYHRHRDTIMGLKRQIFYYMRGFAVAILIQHQRFKHRGNLLHLFVALPKYYTWLLLRGFPFYRGRYTTIFRELRGLFSGLIFYLKNRNTASNNS
jgi:glycosyltransferase involved in cell wall biosynthesis